MSGILWPALDENDESAFVGHGELDHFEKIFMTTPTIVTPATTAATNS
jgi:hypothetical protein